MLCLGQRSHTQEGESCPQVLTVHPGHSGGRWCPPWEGAQPQPTHMNTASGFSRRLRALPGSSRLPLRACPLARLRPTPGLRSQPHISSVNVLGSGPDDRELSLAPPNVHPHPTTQSPGTCPHKCSHICPQVLQGSVSLILKPQRAQGAPPGGPQRSEDLRLVLSREDVTQVPTPGPAQPSGWSPAPGPCPSCRPVHSLLPPPDPRPLPLHSVPSALMP